MYERNNTALLQLSRGKYFAAQLLFRQNQREYPCFLTCHNLGIYYFLEGMELPDGTVRSAKKYGLRFLMRAHEFEGHSPVNLAALGMCSFWKKDYATARTYLEHAIQAEDTYLRHYDLGVICYHLREWSQAALHFSHALKSCDKAEQMEMILPYAFAALYDDKFLAQALLDDIIERNVSIADIDICAFAYMCEDYSLALKLYCDMVPNWKVDAAVGAMALDCCTRLNRRQEKERIFSDQIRRLNEYEYDTGTEIRQLTTAYSDPVFCNSLIRRYQFIPPFRLEEYYLRSIGAE